MAWKFGKYSTLKACNKSHIYEYFSPWIKERDIPNCSGNAFIKLFQKRKLKKFHLKQNDSPTVS